MEQKPPLVTASGEMPKRLSPLKWIAGVLSFVAVVGGSIWLTYWLRGSPSEAPTSGQVVAAGGVGPILVFLLGLAVFVVGCIAWGIVLATRAFTFDYSRPVMPRYGAKLTLSNFMVGLLIQSGLALLIGSMVVPLLLKAFPEGVAIGADAGSTSSYFGAVHVILRYRDSDGGEKRVRIHPETDWTMTAKARAMNDIAARLEMWQQSPRSGWINDATGFPIAATLADEGV